MMSLDKILQGIARNGTVSREDGEALMKFTGRPNVDEAVLAAPHQLVSNSLATIAQRRAEIAADLRALDDAEAEVRALADRLKDEV